jgi:hypothetical protein
VCGYRNERITVAKPNYQYEKRQRELEKKKKKEEKAQRKGSSDGGTPSEENDESSGFAPTVPFDPENKPL